MVAGRGNGACNGMQGACWTKLEGDFLLCVFGFQVRFRVPYNTEFGQHLCISGGVDELGDWQEDSCIIMDWNDGNIWTTECELPSG